LASAETSDEASSGEVDDEAAEETSATDEAATDETASSETSPFGSGGAAVPETFAFAAAYPNPFGQATTLAYAIPERVPVRLVVYDMLGREIAVLVDAEQAAGRYSVRFRASGLPGGVYVAVLRAGAYTQTHQMVRAR
jgi:hypothetical protein